MSIPWRLVKVNNAGTTLATWSSADTTGSSLGIIGNFSWSTNKWGDCTVLTFEVDSTLITLLPGDYLKLYVTTIQGEICTFAGMITEVPNTNKGVAGTVRVRGLSKILEGISLSRQYYNVSLATIFTNLLANLPPLIPIVVNDTTTWDKVIDEYVATNASLYEIIDDMVSLGGGVWWVSPQGISIRNITYNPIQTAPIGGYKINNSYEIEEPYTAVRVQLQNSYSQLFADVGDIIAVDSDHNSDPIHPVVSHPAAQYVVTNSTRHATNPYTVRIGASDYQPVTSTHPTYIYKRLLQDSNLQIPSLVTNNTSTFSTYVDVVLKNHSTLKKSAILHPTADVLSTSSVVIGMLFELYIQRISDSSLDWNLNLTFGGGRNLGTTAYSTWNGETFLTLHRDYILPLTGEENWNDLGYNAEARLFIDSVPSNGILVYGEMYSSFRDANAIQPAISNAWTPIISLAPSSHLADEEYTYRVYPWITYIITTQDMINQIVTQEAPKYPTGFMVVLPELLQSGWIGYNTGEYPAFNVDHYEYELSPETSLLTKIHTTSLVNPYIKHQVNAITKKGLV